MVASHRPPPPNRPILERITPRHEGTFRGPTAIHLKALAHGLVAMESHRLFPTICPNRARLFQSTRAFLERLRAHRSERLNNEHSVVTCPGCQGVQVVAAFTARCLEQANTRGDGTTSIVLQAVTEQINLAYNPTVTDPTIINPTINNTTINN